MTDKDTAIIVGWHFGIEPREAIKMEWTADEITKAEIHCENYYSDPFEFWNLWRGYWTK